MEKFIYHVNEANKYFKTADHLTYVTYSLLKDPKLLLTATKNLQKSIEHIIEAFLKLEQYKKNFTIPQNFESKYALFKSLCIKKHQLSNEMLKTIIEIKSLLDQHQEWQHDVPHQHTYVADVQIYHTQNERVVSR